MDTVWTFWTSEHPGKALSLEITDSALFSFALEQTEGFHLGNEDADLPVAHNAGQDLVYQRPADAGILFEKVVNGLQDGEIQHLGHIRIFIHV